jgi:gamma-glutamyltranspeptidase/glutathione hydrolase
VTHPARVFRLAPALLFVAACSRGATPAATPAPTLPPPVTTAADASRAATAAKEAFPTGWRFEPGTDATFGEHAMVVSVSRAASEAGVEILKAGGNAVDAAVATGFALAVTSPSNGNIGGGGFMTIRLANGATETIDYREIAPAASSRDMYLDEAGKLTTKSTVGYLASGVPGSVAGMSEALKKYGTMSLAQVMAPAIRLADSFVVDSNMSRGGQCSRLIAQFEGKNLFCPGGESLKPGSTFSQPDLARTLRSIAASGPKAFYEGAIADSLVAEMQRGGGIITKADLKNYKPVWRMPVQGTYRGYTIISMPPASSGGTTMIETLNILENFAPLPPPGSAAYSHLLGEALRRSFIDRNAKLADPAFAKVPMAELTSKIYAKTLALQINKEQASKTPAFATSVPEHEETTHYSVVDARGNAVSTTTTLNGGYGSGVWIRGGGFFMNNEMDDFAAAPGQPNMFGLVQGEANAIQPGKRMLSAMAPTIVLDPNGQLLMVSGAAGGPTIITATMEIILNVIEHGMTLADAMKAPRLHHQSLPDQMDYEQRGMRAGAVDSLKAMGHTLGTRGSIATANSILRVKGGWHGVGEPRSGGVAVGY